MRYKNKVDWWIRLLLYTVVFMYVPLYFVVPKDQSMIMVYSFLGSAIIILPFFYGYVELGDEELIVRLSVYKKKIPYESIKSIRLCNNWLSSAAMTVHRIEIIQWDKKPLLAVTYIGPQNREEVYEELQQRCFNLERENPLD